MASIPEDIAALERRIDRLETRLEDRLHQLTLRIDSIMLNRNPPPKGEEPKQAATK